MDDRAGHTRRRRARAATAAVADHDDQPLTAHFACATRRPPRMEPAVADEHTFALTIEASGEVTPAQPDNDASQPEPEEAEQ